MRQLIAFVAFVFSSCSNHLKSDLAVFKATTTGLEQSSKTIDEMTKYYHRQLSEMLNDARNAAQTAVWQPKAARVSELALSTIRYIDKLKSQLVKATGNHSDRASVFESNDFKAVNKVFFQQNKGTELYRQLRNFIDTIYTIDPWLNYSYAEIMRDKFDYLDSAKYDDKAFTRTFFDQLSTPAALSLLAKFENDIRNTEKEIVTYCYHHTLPGCDLQYKPFQTLMGLSSNCVKVGDEIEITAGVGSFSVAAQPNFIVDGKLISANENGIVVYKFKTPSKAGKYNKAVKIKYFKPDGTREEFTKNIEYTVIEEK